MKIPIVVFCSIAGVVATTVILLTPRQGSSQYRSDSAPSTVTRYEGEKSSTAVPPERLWIKVKGGETSGWFNILGKRFFVIPSGVEVEYDLKTYDGKIIRWKAAPKDWAEEGVEYVRILPKGDISYTVGDFK